MANCKVVDSHRAYLGISAGDTSGNGVCRLGEGWWARCEGRATRRRDDRVRRRPTDLDDERALRGARRVEAGPKRPRRGQEPARHEDDLAGDARNVPQQLTKGRGQALIRLRVRFLTSILPAHAHIPNPPLRKSYSALHRAWPRTGAPDWGRSQGIKDRNSVLRAITRRGDARRVVPAR
jgi:hypothetical protein